MRLSCPNCTAEYEVDSALITDAGREVQCSNCGHTWYQRGDAAPEPPAPVAVPRQSSRVEAPQRPPQREDHDDADAPVQTPPRRELDPSVRAILREEAEREAQARAASSAPVARTLKKPGDGGGRPGTPDDRFANLPNRGNAGRGSEPDRDAPRRDDRRERRADDRRHRRRSNAARRAFRVSFLLVLFVAALAILLYVFAPDIARGWPEAEPLLADYVAEVNVLRAEIESWIAIGMDAITRITSGMADAG